MRNEKEKLPTLSRRNFLTKAGIFLAGRDRHPGNSCLCVPGRAFRPC